MHPELLFVRTCDDLAGKLQSYDEYELLRAASLLRQLLLDEHPLVHQANGAHHLKLTFTLGCLPTFPGLPAPSFLYMDDALDPDTAPPRTRFLTANHRRFLAHTIIVNKQRQHSIADVVRLAANVRGGVHRTLSPGERDAALNQLAEQLELGGLPAGIRVIRAISRVTLKGLAPLKNKITERDGR